jgi:hypothetical protein
MFLHRHATIPWNGTNIKDRGFDKHKAVGCTRRQYTLNLHEC